MHVFRPEPIYVIGDSQTIVYADRTYVPTDGTAYTFRSVYVEAITADGLADEDGRFSPSFETALLCANLAARVGDRVEARHRSGVPAVSMLAQLEQRERLDPAIVLHVGSLDLGGIVRVVPFDDFVLPADIEEHFAVAPSCRVDDPDALPVLETLTLYHCRLMGLRRGLQALRRLGFDRIAVMSMPPMPVSGESMEALGKLMNIPTHAARLTQRWRYKVTLVMNYVLRTICLEEGVPFINRWNDQTRGGLLLPGVLQDAIHVSPAGADANARAIIAWLCAETAGVLTSTA